MIFPFSIYSYILFQTRAFANNFGVLVNFDALFLLGRQTCLLHCAYVALSLRHPTTRARHMRWSVGLYKMKNILCSKIVYNLKNSFVILLNSASPIILQLSFLPNIPQHSFFTRCSPLAIYWYTVGMKPWEFFSNGKSKSFETFIVLNWSLKSRFQGNFCAYVIFKCKKWWFTVVIIAELYSSLHLRSISSF